MPVSPMASVMELGTVSVGFPLVARTSTGTSTGVAGFQLLLPVVVMTILQLPAATGFTTPPVVTVAIAVFELV